MISFLDYILIEKKLRVFDFDDTLVRTTSFVFINHIDGTKTKLTPAQYAKYELKSGDQLDFSDFEKVKRPKPINDIIKILDRMAKAKGERRIVILTARNIDGPIKAYLNSLGYYPEVIALGKGDPKAKADWILQQIKQGYDDVFFIDDSIKNVNAVKGLKDIVKSNVKIRAALAKETYK